MIARLLGRLFQFLCGIAALSFLLGLVFGLVRQGGEVANTSVIDTVPNFLAGILLGLLAVFFMAGLGVRVHQTLTGRGSRPGRERDASERQLRLAVRRPAEGVPAITVPDLPADPDPAISMEDD